MSGWQRFFLLLAISAGTMILWPQYENAGLTFMGMFILLWTCIIILFSILINLFAIYKIEFLHRILSLLFVLVMVGSLLAYFPLSGGETPLKRLQNHQWPTTQEVQQGIKRMTFNFDFVRRSVNDQANYVNQEVEKKAEQTVNLRKMVQKQQEAVEEFVVQLEDEE